MRGGGSVNRAERRKREREYKKLDKKKETLYSWLDTLTKDKYDLILGEIRRLSVEEGTKVMAAIQDSLKAVLIKELDLNDTDIQVIYTKLIEYMNEDAEKTRILKESLGGKYMASKKEMKGYMIQDAEELLKDGTSKVEVRERLIEKYPQLSKTEITKAVNKVYKNLKTTEEVNTVLEAIGEEPVTTEELEKANIIESHTEPLEEEKDANDKLIEEDIKTSDNVQNKARNGIEIKSRKKSETLEVQGSNYNYTVIKTQDNLNLIVEVIREDGVRYTSLEELQAIREKAIEEINKEFEEGKEILNLEEG